MHTYQEKPKGSEIKRQTPTIQRQRTISIISEIENVEKKLRAIEQKISDKKVKENLQSAVNYLLIAQNLLFKE